MFLIFHLFSFVMLFHDVHSKVACCENEFLCQWRYAGARLRYKSAGRDGLCESCAVTFYARAGDDVSMTCEPCDPGVSVKTFVWMFFPEHPFLTSGSPICLDSSHISQTNSNSSLTLFNVTNLRNGRYECYLHTKHVSPCTRNTTAPLLLSQTFIVCDRSFPSHLEIKCFLLATGYFTSELNCTWHGERTCNTSYRAYYYHPNGDNTIYSRRSLTLIPYSCPNCEASARITLMNFSENMRIEVIATSGIPDEMKYVKTIASPEFKPAMRPEILASNNSRCLRVRLPLYYFYRDVNSTLEMTVFLMSEIETIQRRIFRVLPPSRNYSYTFDLCDLSPHTTYEVRVRYKVEDSTWSDEFYTSTKTSEAKPSAFAGAALYLPTQKMYIVTLQNDFRPNGDDCKLKLCTTNCSFIPCKPKIIPEPTPNDRNLVILPTNRNGQASSTTFRFSKLTIPPKLRFDWIKFTDKSDLLYVCVQPLSPWNMLTLAYCHAENWHSCREPKFATYCQGNTRCADQAAIDIHLAHKTEKELCFVLSRKESHTIFAAQTCQGEICTYSTTHKRSDCDQWLSPITQTVFGPYICLGWDFPCLTAKSYSFQITQPETYSRDLKSQDIQDSVCGFGRFGIPCAGIHANDSHMRIAVDIPGSPRLYSSEMPLKRCGPKSAQITSTSGRLGLSVSYISLVLALLVAAALVVMLWCSTRHKSCRHCKCRAETKMDLESWQDENDYIDLDDLNPSFEESARCCCYKFPLYAKLGGLERGTLEGNPLYRSLFSPFPWLDNEETSEDFYTPPIPATDTIPDLPGGTEILPMSVREMGTDAIQM